MSTEKKERNTLIATFYNEGRTNRQIWERIQEKGHHDLKSVAGVKTQISRLRKIGKIPQERPVWQGGKITNREVKKLRTKQVDKSRKLQDKGIGKYKPVTFRISEDIEWQLKTLAVNHRQQVSELVREILNDYLLRNREVEK